MLYNEYEKAHQVSHVTSVIGLIIDQERYSYDTWYYTIVVINPRSGLPTNISGVRGPNNAMAEPTKTRRLAYVQRTGRSLWEITQLLPFTRDEYDNNPTIYVNVWY